MKYFQKGLIALMVITILIIGGSVYVNESKKTEAPIIANTEKDLLNEELLPVVDNEEDLLNEKFLLNEETLLSNGCKDLISYDAKAYQDGWEKSFKKQNNLSDSEFNNYINIQSVSLRPAGRTCELEIRYIVKKDWLLVNKADYMTLGVPPTISPGNLPLESDSTQSGRIGVSTINLNDPLVFKSEAEALDYYVDAYKLKGTDAQIQQKGFQYFWNKEMSENSGAPFAGAGGEAFILISGTINENQNKCYNGELSLVSKEMIYKETPCWIN